MRGRDRVRCDVRGSEVKESEVICGRVKESGLE